MDTRLLDILVCPLCKGPLVFDKKAQELMCNADKLAYPSIEERVETCRQVRPDAKVAVVPHSGHWVQYEQAAAVNRLLFDFHA